jgi:hypothetical protein
MSVNLGRYIGRSSPSVPMTLEQTKYLMNRVQQIVTDKITVLKTKHVIEGKELTRQQRASLIRSGKVRLKTNRVDENTEVMEAFDFSKHEWEEKINQRLFDRDQKKLHIAANRIRDQIVLGTAKDALKMIARLERA